jgi:hypothetical protein
MKTLADAIDGVPVSKLPSLADALGIEAGKLAPRQTPDVPVDLKLAAETFAKQILSSAEYRSSLQRRVVMDELPPAVETMLWHFAYGKPKERIEHTGKDGQPIETITEVRRVIIRATPPQDFVEAEPPQIEVTH